MKKIDPKTISSADVEAWALQNPGPAKKVGMILIFNQKKSEAEIRELVSKEELPKDPMIDAMISWAAANRMSATMVIAKLAAKLA